jgi:hypothetical protein
MTIECREQDTIPFVTLLCKLAEMSVAYKSTISNVKLVEQEQVTYRVWTTGTDRRQKIVL